MDLRGTVEVLNHREPMEADSFLESRMPPQAVPWLARTQVGDLASSPGRSSFLLLSAALPCACPCPSHPTPQTVSQVIPSPASRKPLSPLFWTP